MSAHISELLALELHPILRLAPLELKNLCIQAGAKYSEKNTTAIFSNMSAVKMHASYVPYIERFGVYTNTPKFELCLCSFQDKLSFAFTSACHAGVPPCHHPGGVPAGVGERRDTDLGGGQTQAA